LEQARHGAVPGRRLSPLARGLRRGDEAQSAALRSARRLRPDLFPARAIRARNRVLEARTRGQSEPERRRNQHPGHRAVARRAAAARSVITRIAADGVLVAHLAFILFASFGALLALRWRWIPFVQLPAAAWGFFVEATGRICPLTFLESALRMRAGASGYGEGFIEHYLLALVYPA